MLKSLIPHVIALIVLSFTVGCVPQEPQTVSEPEQIEALKVEVVKAKPRQIEPVKAEPVKEEAEPVKVEAPKVETPKVETVIAKPVKVEEPPKVSRHEMYAGLLNEFVNEDGLVNYKMLKRNKLELRILLNELADLKPKEYNSWSEETKIAFWINAYNIQMLNIIVENYPIDSKRVNRLWWPPNSIRHIPPRSEVGVKKWNRYKFIVMDEEFTLSEIQKRFFRGEFDEPSVFFALSQASHSGPALLNKPYTSDKLYDQLDEQTRKFLSRSDCFAIDKNKLNVYLSVLFMPTWYGESFIDEFGTDKKFKDQKTHIRAVLNFIKNYISEQDVYFLERGVYTVRYIKYDWKLNE